MNVALYKNLSGGFTATVRINDDEINVARRRSGSHKDVCLSAAKILRAAADRFDALSVEKMAVHEDVQTQINYRRKPSAEKLDVVEASLKT